MSDLRVFKSKFVASNVTRAIPEPTADLESIYNTVKALTEVVRTLTRQRDDPLYSAVTVDDLHKLGFDELL